MRIATAAAAVASFGDLLMLWVANSGRAELELVTPPTGTLWMGAVLGILAIPFYRFGYAAMAEAIAAELPTIARAIAACGALIAAIGALIHAYTGFLIGFTTEQGATPLEAMRSAGAPILTAWFIATLCTIFATGLLMFAIFRLRSSALRSFYIVNPVVLTLLIALPSLIWEVGRSFLAPAAPNIAHLLFYAWAARRSRLFFS